MYSIGIFANLHIHVTFSLKKNFNMERAPVEHSEKTQNAARLRAEIEELFNETEGAFKTLTEFAPEVIVTEVCF